MDRAVGIVTTQTSSIHVSEKKATSLVERKVGGDDRLDTAPYNYRGSQIDILGELVLYHVV